MFVGSHKYVNRCQVLPEDRVHPLGIGQAVAAGRTDLLVYLQGSPVLRRQYVVAFFGR